LEEQQQACKCADAGGGQQKEDCESNCWVISEKHVCKSRPGDDRVVMQEVANNECDRGNHLLLVALSIYFDSTDQEKVRASLF
jgi:hypothetical protein